MNKDLINKEFKSLTNVLKKEFRKFYSYMDSLYLYLDEINFSLFDCNTLNVVVTGDYGRFTKDIMCSNFSHRFKLEFDLNSSEEFIRGAFHTILVQNDDLELEKQDESISE